MSCIAHAYAQSVPRVCLVRKNKEMLCLKKEEETETEENNFENKGTSNNGDFENNNYRNVGMGLNEV